MLDLSGGIMTPFVTPFEIFGGYRLSLVMGHCPTSLTASINIPI